MLKLTTIALATLGAVALPIGDVMSESGLVACESAPGGYCNHGDPVGGLPAVCFATNSGLCYGGKESSVCGSRGSPAPGMQFCDDKTSPPPPPSPPNSPPMPNPPSSPPAPPNAPFVPGSCPQWAHEYFKTGDYSKYVYEPEQWGGDNYRTIHGGTPSAHGNGQDPTGFSGATTTADESATTAITNAACSWAAACKQAVDQAGDQAATELCVSTRSTLMDAEACKKDPLLYCLKRTPAAIGVMYGESGLSPVSQAWDGNGRGLIQFDFYNSVDGQVISDQCKRCHQNTPPTGAAEADCNACTCLVGPDKIAHFPRNKSNYPVTKTADLQAWSNTCASFNPLRILKQAVVNSYAGQTFGGTSKSPWWACTNDASGQSAFAQSEEVAKDAAAAIYDLTGTKLQPADFVHTDQCVVKDPNTPSARCGNTWSEANDKSKCMPACEHPKDCTGAYAGYGCFSIDDPFKC